MAIKCTNLSPTDALGGDTPYHAFWGKEGAVDYLRVFGCAAYRYIEHRHKLQNPGKMGIFVGYDENNPYVYKVYDPETGVAYRSAHVRFNEDLFPAPDLLAHFFDDPESVGGRRGTVGAPQAPETGGAAQGARSTAPQEPVGASGEATGESQQAISSGTRTSARQRKAPDRMCLQLTSEDAIDQTPEQRGITFGELVAAIPSIMMLSGVDGNTGPAPPVTVAQALSDPRWAQAHHKEVKALEANDVFTVVHPSEVPPGRKAMRGRMLYTVKQDGSFKARFVANGRAQKEGLDYLKDHVSSPVLRMASFRVCLALAAKLGLHAHSMDVDTAYLQTMIDMEIYMVLPKGMSYKGHNPGKDGCLVVRVNRSLYGFRQSGRNWNEEIDAWLRSYGLVPSKADPCVYVKGSLNSKEGLLIVALYVDDLPIFASKLETLLSFKRAISRRFMIKDQGELRTMLGMEIKRDWGKGTIEISQRRYILEIAKRYGMLDCKPAHTPMTGELPRGDKEKGAQPSAFYMGMVGSLLYAAMVSRPDIAFAVQVLGRSLQASTPAHIAAAKQVFRYLMGTLDMTLKFGGVQQVDPMHGYCDSDFASDRETRRSVTAYVFMISGGAVSWASKLQPTVALSTAEAEYMCLAAGTQEAVYLRQLLGDLGFTHEGPTTIFEDNQACIAMSKKAGDHSRAKHIDVRYHFVRERQAMGEILVTYVPTEHQLADLLTKPLDRNKIEYLRGRILGHA